MCGGYRTEVNVECIPQALFWRGERSSLSLELIDLASLGGWLARPRDLPICVTPFTEMTDVR